MPAVLTLPSGGHDFPVTQTVNHLPAMRETRAQSLGWEDLLEKEMAPHSSILAWKIPWTEEPVGLQVQGVANSRTRLSDFPFTILPSLPFPLQS